MEEKERAIQKILTNLLNRYPILNECREEIENAYGMIIRTYKGGGKLLVCGNGGSAADSQHIVGELMKGFKLKRQLTNEIKAKLTEYNNPEYREIGNLLASKLQMPLKSISLSAHSSLVTAFANDVGYEFAFAQQVLGYGERGDTLIGISTSGNSTSVNNAIFTAKSLGLNTIGLTGKNGGKLKELCDITILVPEDETYAIQELHLPVYHALCAMTEMYFFG